MNQPLQDALCRTAAALSEMFGKHCETVVQDFSNADCRIVAIYNGHVSGRTAFSTETIYGVTISLLDCKELIPNCDYVNTMVITKDGRRIKTTSINFIGQDYHYVLGINFDISAIASIGGILGELLHVNGDFAESPFADRKLTDAFDQGLSFFGKSADSLDKSERMQLCKLLDDNGVFSIQKAVPYVSERLGVSRYTVYNYLKQIREK